MPGYLNKLAKVHGLETAAIEYEYRGAPIQLSERVTLNTGDKFTVVSKNEMIVRKKKFRFSNIDSIAKYSRFLKQD